MKLIADLDGVVRNLNGYLSLKYDVPMPETWTWSFLGKNIFDWVKHDNFDILTESPPSEYYSVIKKYAAEIWTSQPDNWRPHTIQWCEM